MMRRDFIFHIILFILVAFPSFVFASEQACSSAESWKSLELEGKWKKRFQQYLRKDFSAIEGMAMARSLRSEAVTRYEQLFSQYWLSHAMERVGTFPIAADGFERLASVIPQGDEYSTIREASFACLMKVHHQQSARSIPKKLYSSWTKLPTSDLKDYIAYRWAIEQGQYQQSLKQMSKDSPLRDVIGALKDWENRDWRQGAQKMDAYFTKPLQHVYLESHINYWRILAARMHFASSSFKAAVKYLSLVNKQANELVPALTELAWAQLKSGQYNDAIGTSLSLQTGWLQNTYSPEGLMVMSMAFNETCYYPESMRSLELLRKQYGPVAKWLKDNKKMSGDALYEELKKSLNKKSDAPFRLTSEWVKSSVFLSQQSEINAILGQSKFQEKAEEQAKLRQRIRVAKLLKDVRQIKKDIEDFRKTESHTALIPDWIEVKMSALRNDLEEYVALRAFAPVWKLVKRSNKKVSSKRRAVLLGGIKKHIRSVNRKVAAQLDDINENIKFIEVEIYQGATQDMIFTNANPDYTKKLASLKQKKGFQLNANEMKWGSISTNDLNKGEIWEDELGGFKADLPNKCTNAKVARSN